MLASLAAFAALENALSKDPQVKLRKLRARDDAGEVKPRPLHPREPQPWQGDGKRKMERPR